MAWIPGTNSEHMREKHIYGEKIKWKYVGSKKNERRYQQRRGKTYAEKTGNINKQGTNICRENNINDKDLDQYMQRREPPF